MVRVFTTPACPYCYTLKEYLKEHNIEFQELDVAGDEVARKEMIEKSGQMGAPVIEINGEWVTGFDKAKIEKLLKIER